RPVRTDRRPRPARSEGQSILRAQWAGGAGTDPGRVVLRTRINPNSRPSIARLRKGPRMLDLKYVIANAESVRQNCRNRNVPAEILDEVDRVVALDEERKALLHRVEDARRRQNEVAQATGKEKDP